MRAVVVGGGISGLAAALRLRQVGWQVQVLEASTRAGGKIRSEALQGYLIEHGPNGFLDGRLAALRLAQAVGLGGGLLPAADAAQRRYLFCRGKLRRLPAGPGSFLFGDLIPPLGRLRLLAEPFVPARRGAGDETVFAFAERRIGRAAAETLVDPMVSGIYAGDARQLSLPAAFPKLAHLEAEYGGLLRGMVGRARARKRQGDAPGSPAGPAGTLTSFPGGLGDLVGALVEALGDSLQLGRPALGLAQTSGGWRVEAGGGPPVEAEAVVLATPAPAMARLLGALRPAAVAPLEGIRYAPIAVVALGFPSATLPRPLDGFGFLIPTKERRRVLGVLWTSAIFPGRAPTGYSLLRIMVGGARQAELLERDDDALVALVRSELEVTMGRMAPPSFQRVVRWDQGIPQYTLGHLDRVAAVEAAVGDLPGLFLAGNALYGVSLADCAARAEVLADQIPKRMGG